MTAEEAAAETDGFFWIWAYVASMMVTQIPGGVSHQAEELNDTSVVRLVIG